jgi:hypothetical protein
MSAAAAHVVVWESKRKGRAIERKKYEVEGRKKYVVKFENQMEGKGIWSIR